MRGANVAKGASAAPASAHHVALTRLLTEAWGKHGDRERQLRVGLPDARHWRRVRLRPFPFFTGFKYGKDYDALEAVRVEQLPPGVPVTSRSCLRATERWALPKLRAFDVQFSDVQEHRLQWRDQSVQARSLEVSVDYAFKRLSYSVGWMALPAYEQGCLVLMFAVRQGDTPELAQRVRDRWLQESARFVRPRTSTLPVRKSS